MKKAIDAVNEFEGKLSKYINSNHTIYINPDNERWYFNNGLCPVIGVVACTYDEFLSTVAECETNFGRWSQIAIQAWKDGDKTLLDKELDVDIDWSQAPEGATHYGYETGTHYKGFYKILDISDGFWHDGVNWLACNSWPDIAIKPVQQPTPIFTQEMADNGVFPSVGMEFMGKGYAYKEYTKSWFKLEALGVYNGQVIAESCSEANQVQLYSEFKPLTPPKTDKEKLIEEFQNALHDAFGTHTTDDWSSIEDITSDLFDSFLIQPLTAGAK